MQFTFTPIDPLAGSERQREDEVRKRLGLLLGTTIFMAGSTCIAQKAPIPFDRLQWNTETPPQPAEMSSAEASTASSTVLPSVTASAPSAVDSPVRNMVANGVAGSPRLGARFLLLNGLDIGMAALDESLSQHCINESRCREANPLMPPSLAGRISIVAAVAALDTYVSHRLKKQGSSLWWIPPVFGIAAHSVGAASGFANQ